VPESFGDWLIDEELPQRGIELTEFAREIGVSTSTIYRWRARNPRSSMVGRVARVLDLPFGELTERFGMGAKKKRDDEDELVERAARELAAYPPEVYEAILRRVEADRRRRQDVGNQKDS
jgi:transcriptional regulator with XRE-family HTH domain